MNLRKAIKYTALTLNLSIVMLLGYHFYLVFISANTIDPALRPYYDSFLKEAAIRNRKIIPLVKVDIVFHVDKDHFNLGRCRNQLGAKPKIRINKPKWHLKNLEEREQIMYHELSHCLLFRGHTDSKNTIMTRNPVNSHLYLENREFYVNEIFSYSFQDAKDWITTVIDFSKFSSHEH